MGPLLFQTLYCIAGMFAAAAILATAALIAICIYTNKEKDD